MDTGLWGRGYPEDGLTLRMDKMRANLYSANIKVPLAKLGLDGHDRGVKAKTLISWDG